MGILSKNKSRKEAIKKSPEQLKVEKMQATAREYAKKLVADLLESSLTYEVVTMLISAFQGELKIVVGKSKINFDKTAEHEVINKKYSDIGFSKFKEESEEAVKMYELAMSQQMKQ